MHALVSCESCTSNTCHALRCALTLRLSSSSVGHDSRTIHNAKYIRSRGGMWMATNISNVCVNMKTWTRHSRWRKTEHSVTFLLWNLKMQYIHVYVYTFAILNSYYLTSTKSRQIVKKMKQIDCVSFIKARIFCNFADKKCVRFLALVCCFKKIGRKCQIVTFLNPMFPQLWIHSSWNAPKDIHHLGLKWTRVETSCAK